MNHSTTDLVTRISLIISLLMINGCVTVHEDTYFLPNLQNNTDVRLSFDKEKLLVKTETFSTDISIFVSRRLKATGPAVIVPLPVIPKDEDAGSKKRVELFFWFSTKSDIDVVILPEKITLHTENKKQISPYLASDWNYKPFSTKNARIIFPGNSNKFKLPRIREKAGIKFYVVYNRLSLAYDIDPRSIDKMQLNLDGIYVDGNQVKLPPVIMAKGKVKSSQISP